MMISKATIDTDTNEKLTVSPDTEYQDKEISSTITKRDLWIVGFRGLFMEGNFNYERMQAGGFCFSIIPALKKIHRNPHDFSLALKNNLSFYNAHPKLFTFPLGLAIAMEENKEKPETINAIKAATMGPTGGIGDAIDHMTMMPLTLGVGAAISLQGSIAGPFVFLFCTSSITFLFISGCSFLAINPALRLSENYPNRQISWDELPILLA